MIKTLTQNDLLRYLYDELPPEEREEMMNAQLTDGEVEHEAEEMEDVKSLLDQFSMKAPEGAVERIMNYSRQYKGN